LEFVFLPELGFWSEKHQLIGLDGFTFSDSCTIFTHFAPKYLGKTPQAFGEYEVYLPERGDRILFYTPKVRSFNQIDIMGDFKVGFSVGV
jgi:hypothetical protein